jgi:hypothetical protein
MADIKEEDKVQLASKPRITEYQIITGSREFWNSQEPQDHNRLSYLLILKKDRNLITYHLRLSQKSNLNIEAIPAGPFSTSFGVCNFSGYYSLTCAYLEAGSCTNMYIIIMVILR